MASVNDIAFRTSIAAINAGNRIRVYTCAVDGGVRESQLETSWTGGKAPDNVVATSKISSAISSAALNLDAIRVHYLDSTNTLNEAYYINSSKAWGITGLNTKKFVVAPYSSLATTYLSTTATPVDIHVYGQLADNTIQEFYCNKDNPNWVRGKNFGAALPGTSLAVVTNQPTGSAPATSLQVYYQSTDLSIVAKGWTSTRGWYDTDLHFGCSVPRTPLAATSWIDSSGWHIRLYHGVDETPNQIRELCWDGSNWVEGGFRGPCIPGSQVAAVCLAPANVRVYLQNGTYVSGVSEWRTEDTWTLGVKAIPPA